MAKQKKFTKAQRDQLGFYWGLKNVAEDKFYKRLREIESDMQKALGIPVEFMWNMEGEIFGIGTWDAKYELLDDTRLDTSQKLVD